MKLIQIRGAKSDSSWNALSLKVQEHLSQEPSYLLEMASPDPDVDLDALLGGQLTFDIDLGEGDARKFNAFVLAGYDTGQLGELYTYTLELGSWLSFLEENRNCRIFQNLTVPKIVEQIFNVHNRTNFKFDLEKEYDTREYCVQFRETDLNFVKRLLEDEGIYFWVEHESDNHTIVISDTQRFDDLQGDYSIMRFLPDGEEQRAIKGREGIQRLQRTRRIRPNNIALRDYDYNAPRNRLDSDASVEQQALAGIQLEDYDYAAGYYDTTRGERLARLRLEAVQADAHLLVGQANAAGIATGGAFTLEGHPDSRRNRRYHIVGSDLAFVQGDPDSGSVGRNVSCAFRALDDDRPFHPLRLTPAPAVSGLQSATVVGPVQSEVHTDKLGRIRVHFHWDRYKTDEEDASCWIRVSQAWAGKGWGMLAMPRVGQEVLVTYVDGDLDRPLVTGIVYNGDNPTPYDLPKDIRYTGLVSRSLNFGVYQNASQITFDDQPGEERVMIHAERDHQVTTERNSAISVGQDASTSITGTQTIASGYSINTTTSSSTTVDQVNYSTANVNVAAINTSLATTNLAVQMTGVSAAFYGMSATFTGVALDFSGAAMAFIGLSARFVGISMEVTGLSASFTGTAISLTGINFSVIGVNVSAMGESTELVGKLVKAVGVSATLIGHDATLIGQEIRGIGNAIWATGCRIAATGCIIAATGVNMEVNDAKVEAEKLHLHIADTKIQANSAYIHIIGANIKALGIQIKC